MTEEKYKCENCEKSITNFCWTMSIEETDIASDFGTISVFCSKKCAKVWFEHNVYFEKLKVGKDGLEVIKVIQEGIR